MEYPQKQLLSVVFNSKYRSYGPQSMHKKLKNIDSTENYPGPGQYKIPSEFGHYESKYAKQVDEELAKKFKEEDDRKKAEHDALINKRKTGQA